jgi:hypothetical protein
VYDLRRRARESRDESPYEEAPPARNVEGVMLEEVYVICSNDFPEEVTVEEEEARRICAIRNAEEEAEHEYLTGRRVHWHYHSRPFLDEGFVQVYRCSNCGELRPWCDGAHDNRPLWCDKCWAEEDEKPWWWRKIAKLFKVGSHGCSECAVIKKEKTCS